MKLDNELYDEFLSELELLEARMKESAAIVYVVACLCQGSSKLR